MTTTKSPPINFRAPRCPLRFDGAVATEKNAKIPKTSFGTAKAFFLEISPLFWENQGARAFFFVFFRRPAARKMFRWLVQCCSMSLGVARCSSVWRHSVLPDQELILGVARCCSVRFGRHSAREFSWVFLMFWMCSVLSRCSAQCSSGCKLGLGVLLGVAQVLLGVARCCSVFLGVARCSSVFLSVARCSSVFLGVAQFGCARCSSALLGVPRCSSVFLGVPRCSSVLLGLDVLGALLGLDVLGVAWCSCVAQSSAVFLLVCVFGSHLQCGWEFADEVEQLQKDI